MERKVLVIDAMAIVHCCVAELSQLAHPPDLEMYVAAQLEWLGSGLWWDGFSGIPPSLVWCWDSKPYWRNSYLLRDDVWSKITPHKRKKPQPPAPIHYKGGRSIPPSILATVRVAIKKVIEKKCQHSLKEWCGDYGYEADDLAALVVQVNRMSEKPREICLLTRDKDWLGLLGPEVTWLNPNYDHPRVRTLANYAYTFKQPFQQPTDIWVYKSNTGDTSDNLPNCCYEATSAAALLPVIDLFNPPDEYKLLSQDHCVTAAKIALTVDTPECRHGVRAANALRRHGLKACVPLIIDEPQIR